MKKVTTRVSITIPAAGVFKRIQLAGQFFFLESTDLDATPAGVCTVHPDVASGDGFPMYPQMKVGICGGFRRLFVRGTAATAGETISLFIVSDQDLRIGDVGVVQPIIPPILSDGADLPTDLALYLTLDEAVTGPRADSSGNGYTFTDNNTVQPTLAADPPGGNAALFVFANGESLTRVVNSEAWEILLGDLSISFWIKPTAWDQINNVVIACGVSTTSIEGYRVSFGSNGAELTISLAKGSFDGLLFTAIPTGGAPTIGVWHHFICQWDRSAKMQVWQNGNQLVDGVGANGKDITPLSAKSIAAAHPLTIGKNSAAADNYLNAAVDELMISNRLYTPIEKVWLHNDGIPRRFAELG